MRTAVVPAVTVAAAGVLLTAGAAIADTPTPTSTTGGGWTVTDTRTGSSTPASDAPAGPARRSSRRQSVSRAGTRLATGCQAVRDGVWRVRPGDTLWRISICTHRDLADLVTLNDLPDGGRLIFPGDPVTILWPAR
jgi:hypothetical protein